MSPKKQHEVANLASLINAVASKQGIERIMDIGAGQGYLDISLAFQYGKTVIGVDDDEIQTCGAKRRTDIVNSYVQRRASDGVGKLLHVNRRVHKNETFASLLDDVSGSQDSHWLLCGLHSCGDLTPAVMKHFLESEATALVVVGCCYNKLTEKKPSEPHLHENVGFPLSSYLLSQSPRFHLGFSARTLACQATCRWTEPDDGGAENFKKHHYRALLQFVLHQHGLMERARNNSKPSPDHDIIIGRLKPNAFSSGFASYAKLALSRLHIDADAEGLAHEILQRYDDRYKGRELEIAIVWTLRSMMGDIFESLLLADRFLFLTEQLQDDGSLVQLVPLFEPIISPRNMALIAVKAK
ncbi:methyltransferase domain-containing protein [Chytriomyces sp. MP71]|nr:methyltransferase domain-containing protein [Chytriomyces sp. MP71]